VDNKSDQENLWITQIGPQTGVIVGSMTGLLRRRTARHLAIAIAPLLVIGIALLVVLAVRFARDSEPVRAATGTAQATVTSGGLGDDGTGVDLRWTDPTGAARTSRIVVPRGATVRVGATVSIQFQPGDLSKVYVDGDQLSDRLRDLAFGILITIFALVLVLVVTAVHVLRRRAAERRPAATVPVTHARSKRGLVQRSWLIVHDKGRDTWVPVHWEPPVTDALVRTPVTVHGVAGSGQVVAFEIDGTPVWQSGRQRPGPPRGEVTIAEPPAKGAASSAPAEAVSVGLGRQFRVDGALTIIAPLLGLLWGYFDGSGVGGFVSATLLMVGVLLWLPSVLGTDPT
jgi:hypothetical protein